MGSSLLAEGGLVTTASVDLASAYVSRSVSPRSPLIRSASSSRMSSTPAASQRRRISAVCGCSRAERVTRTRRGVQRRWPAAVGDAGAAGGAGVGGVDAPTGVAVVGVVRLISFGPTTSWS
jgi:hypothetical protein